MSKKEEKLAGDPYWYKDAIIYEIRVRSFYDSNGDGIGDFKGLTEKLDYLQGLGVNALWLLPFYPSPLRDDGYDISDYNNIHPDCGTINDFKVFMKEAKKRGLRIITELVINHTSDQHPWFKKSRKNPPDKFWRDFYVWNDSIDKYKKARIIFKDFEPSNWTWDPVAKSFFWHRFFSHQPDLNFENPAVHKAVFQSMEFWMSMGVDGVRLDAIPYLYEKDGTDCENLDETHQFIKKLRHQVDKKFKHRMLLAEANQWPEDAVEYFGDGDECNMAFHFPIMPRLFMSIHMEDRYPIIDILEQTPAIPESCQWALFLRNHDELTLEMVTDEERDYMNRVYAADPQARVNLGIRRRLSPLLGNNRRKIELMNGLLFSLPGTPVLYYGDEIGMGDNIYLGDRNSVRTPMQWSGDRNAGFSRANPQKLYLPVNIDSEYHYETVNVESMQNNPHSIYWWMKRLIALRKRYRAFGRGTFKVLNSNNPKVLTFVREYEDEKILVVANLSRFVQFVELEMAQYKGMIPVELFGQIEFPSIGDLPYFVTLGPHSFYWFSLKTQKQGEISDGNPNKEIPVLQTVGRWEDVFKGRSKNQLEELLPRYFLDRRWFGGKSRKIKSTQIVDVVPMSNEKVPSRLTLVRVDYTEGQSETYVFPLAYATGERMAQIIQGFPQTILSRVYVKAREAAEDGVLYDAMIEPQFSSTILNSIARGRTMKGEMGEIRAVASPHFKSLRGEPNAVLEPTGIRAEQSNSSTVFGNKMILKLFRRFDPGVNPDLEIGQFLSQEAQFGSTPALAGYLEYKNGHKGEPSTLGILTGFVPNEGDAWRFTLDELGRYFERTTSKITEGKEPPVSDMPLLKLAESPLPELAGELIGSYLESARLLGQRTAELHLALSVETENPQFTPELFTPFSLRSLYQSFRDQSIKVFTLLKKKSSQLPESVREQARQVLKQESLVMDYFQNIRKMETNAVQIRCHGDYHLGQVLFTGKDFVIIDFEGEPARSLNERRRKRSPLRDVAGMIRSFHYAAYSGLSEQITGGHLEESSVPQQEKWAQFWYQWVSASFLKSYLQYTAHAPFIPESKDQIELLLNSFILDKAVYELNYELNNRPHWIHIPIQGISQLIEKIKK